MRVIITYDLTENRLHESKHSQVKDTMKANGYHDYFTIERSGKKETYYLPNTTLWKNNITPTQAKDDLIAAARKHNADVERLFADEFTDNWAAISGKKYAHE
jgi:hypothetical protein